MGEKSEYCNMCGPLKDGVFHLTPCYRSEKAVVVERTMTYIISAPYFFTTEDIEFARNESCSCADNDLHDLLKTNHHCTCMSSHVKVLRDADDMDLRHLPRTFPMPGEKERKRG